ncbi:UDP-2,4-diacetamido-2,4, 6-trideoxy-beta-L-altropyranose hydrolase [uncultured Gammaproteobacteria bacterium]
MIDAFAFGDQGRLAPGSGGLGSGLGQRVGKVMTGPILIRADAGPELGTGHVMRCLAVAEALQDLGHTCHFLCAALPPALAQRLTIAGFPVHSLTAPAGSVADAAQAAALAETLDAPAVVLDGYHFGPIHHAALTVGRRPLLVFDDLAVLELFSAAAVVNPSPAALALPYSTLAPEARLLLGPRYAPLRRQFRAVVQAGRRAPAGCETVLVSFGGADPLSLTAPCLARLARVLPSTCRLAVTIGAGDRCAEVIIATAAGIGAERVTVHRDTATMATLIGLASMAVAAAGGTVFELAALAVPAVLVVVADNQLNSARWMADQGLAPVIDGRAADAVDQIAEAAVALWVDEARRRALSAALAGRIDGQGALRIAVALLALAFGDQEPRGPGG